MGVKVLQCFPWYRRCKERSKGRQRPPTAGEENGESPPAENARLSSTASWGSENEGGGAAAGPQAYYSQKARVSFRHQMDGNVNAIDATY